MSYLQEFSLFLKPVEVSSDWSTLLKLPFLLLQPRLKLRTAATMSLNTRQEGRENCRERERERERETKKESMKDTLSYFEHWPIIFKLKI